MKFNIDKKFFVYYDVVEVEFKFSIVGFVILNDMKVK